VGTEGTLMTAAISALATGIEQNGRSGGKLQVLNLLENRLSSNVEQTCQECIASFMETWNAKMGGEGDNSGAWRSEVLRRRYFMNSPECKSCKGTPEVTELLEAAARHPHLTSLLGITPSTRHVELGCLRCCDQHMRLLEAELRRSHTIESVDLDNNGLSVRGLEIVLDAVRESLVLSSFRVSMDDLVGTTGTTGLDVGVRALKVEASAVKSFRYRVALAVFVHGFSHLGARPCKAILEFAIGPGPLVERFLRHRIVLTDWVVNDKGEDSDVEELGVVASEEQSMDRDGGGQKRKVQFALAGRSLASPEPLVPAAASALPNDSNKHARRRLTYQS